MIQGKEALILTDHLNVRMGPGIEYDVITQIQQDEIYPVVQEENGWLKIVLQNYVGWVSNEFVTIQGTPNSTGKEANVPVTTESEEVTAIHAHTHVRKGPSVSEEIIDFIDDETILTILHETEDWYEVAYKEQTGFIHRSFLEGGKKDFHQWSEQTIVIDAGHGGRDTGAIGVHGYYEKDFITLTAEKLTSTLQKLGATVHLTREDDENIRLGSRPVLANTQDTDAFISLHYNSFDQDRSVKGVGTYYYDPYDKQLAYAIQEGIIEKTGANDRGVLQDDFLVLRQNYKPSVLIELGFISHPDKEELLFTDAYQQKLVDGIIIGLTNTLIQP